MNAVGHGFISPVPIDRVEFDVQPDLVMVGAFVGLVVGEPSLGTVTIPGYNGPQGEVVELDFAISWGDCATCPDLDGNGSVDIGDLFLMFAQWGQCPPLCIGDLDGDGWVGITDLFILFGRWGPCP